jgi:hypothetical protein
MCMPSALDMKNQDHDETQKISDSFPNR